MSQPKFSFKIKDLSVFFYSKSIEVAPKFSIFYPVFGVKLS
jgi:hypothetical protein